MQSVSSGAVYSALGMGGWTKVVNLSNVSYIEYKEIGNDTILHIHFQGYLQNTTISIGSHIYTLPSNLRPSETKRGLIDIDMASGRCTADIDVNTNGGIYVYPIILNQLAGNITIANGMYGDVFVIIS